MAVYLCGEKVKVNLGGVVYCVNLFSTTLSGIKLSSFDDFILKDSKDLYLTVKDGE